LGRPEMGAQSTNWDHWRDLFKYTYLCETKVIEDEIYSLIGIMRNHQALDVRRQLSGNSGCWLEKLKTRGEVYSSNMK